MHESVKIKLSPMPHRNLSKNTPEKKKDVVKGKCNTSPKFKALYVINTKEIIKATKDNVVVYALVAKESPEQTVEIPPTVEPVFKQFQDVSPDDLPNSLPPMHHIQHMIDLVPSTTLPKPPTL